MPARINVFAGHFGSGKTNLAVNYGLWLKKTHENVIICDLDIVNPYFYAGNFRGLLAEKDVKLISRPLAEANAETVYTPYDAQMLFDDTSCFGVIDLGGNDGALALGRYKRDILGKNNYEMLMVINIYRPLSRDINALTELKESVESASGVPFTGIVNNPNIGRETAAEDITGSFRVIQEFSEKTGLPLRFTAVEQRFLNDESFTRSINNTEIFPVEVFYDRKVI